MNRQITLRYFTYITIILCSVNILTCCAPQKNRITYTKTTLPQTKNKKTNYATSKKQTQSSTTNKTSTNLNSISKKLGITVTNSDNQKLYREAASWMGTRYKYGGTSKSGVDCSGFTHLMYKNVYGKTISRQSSAILNNNCKRISKGQLKEGDLVFFRTDGKKSSVPNHVGIYLKQNKFIHASSSKGVVISDLTTNYYVENWITGGRVVK